MSAGSDITKVFLSYSNKDLEVARQVVDELEKLGVQVFFAKRDILSGRKYGEVIVRTIRESDCLVGLVSKASLASEYVLNELDLARSLTTTVLPYTFENLEHPQDFPDDAVEFFQRRQVQHVSSPVELASAVGAATRRAAEANRSTTKAFDRLPLPDGTVSDQRKAPTIVGEVSTTSTHSVLIDRANAPVGVRNRWIGIQLTDLPWATFAERVNAYSEDDDPQIDPAAQAAIIDAGTLRRGPLASTLIYARSLGGHTYIYGYGKVELVVTNLARYVRSPEPTMSYNSTGRITASSRMGFYDDPLGLADMPQPAFDTSPSLDIGICIDESVAYVPSEMDERFDAPIIELTQSLVNDRPLGDSTPGDTVVLSSDKTGERDEDELPFVIDDENFPQGVASRWLIAQLTDLSWDDFARRVNRHLAEGSTAVDPDETLAQFDGTPLSRAESDRIVFARAHGKHTYIYGYGKVELQVTNLGRCARMTETVKLYGNAGNITKNSGGRFYVDPLRVDDDWTDSDQETSNAGLVLDTSLDPETLFTDLSGDLLDDAVDFVKSMYDEEIPEVDEYIRVDLETD